MKRLRACALRCVLIACVAALSLCLAGCSQETYTPASGTATVSSPTIGEDGVLRVGVNTSSVPLAGESTTTGNIVGIDVDIAAALADELGLKVEIIDVGDDAATALSEGTVDIVLGVDSSSTSETYWLSDTYLQTAVALFALADSSSEVPSNDSTMTVAAQVSSQSAWAITNLFDEAVLSTTTSLEDAFTALGSEKVSYVASDAIIGTFAAYSIDLDVQIVALLEDAGGYSVAVLTTNTDLQVVVSEALDTLASNGTITLIEKKWLGTTVDLSSVAVVDDSTSDEEDADAEDESSDDSTDEDAAE